MEYSGDVWLLFSYDMLDKIWDNELQKNENTFLKTVGEAGEVCGYNCAAYGDVHGSIWQQRAGCKRLDY